MSMGAFGENFPYTNFHDLNLDWILKKLREIVEDNIHTREELEKLINDFDALKEYVDNFLDHLDVPEYVKDYLDEMVEDGSMQEMLEDVVIAPQFKQINTGNLPMILGHQGDKTFCPGNTAPAFKQVKLAGFQGFECDVQFTSDNVPVCSHNDTLNSMTTSTGLISETSLSSLLNLHVSKGTNAELFPNLKYCTIADALRIAKYNGMRIMLDISGEHVGKFQYLYAELQHYQLSGNNVIIASASVEALKYFVDKPENFITFLYQTSDFNISAMIETALANGIDGIGFPYSAVQSDQAVIDIHNAGLMVEVFSLGWDKQRMQASITRYIDVLITDGIKMFDNNTDLDADTPTNKPVTAGMIKGLIYINDFEKDQILHGGFIRRNVHSLATVEYPANMNRYSNIRGTKSELIRIKYGETITFPETPANRRIWIYELDSDGLLTYQNTITSQISTFTPHDEDCVAISVCFAHNEDEPITDYELMEMDISFSNYR